MSGVFITFEGVEGSGKSTQIRLLADFLCSRGLAVGVTREPGGTPLAERIRGLLMETAEERMAPLAELFLYEAARAQHVDTLIKPSLDRGAVVLCDRFADSTTAYQGAGRRLSAETVSQLNRLAAAAVWPSHTFVLDLPAEEGRRRARERGSDDRMMQEALDFHERIRAEFALLARQEPDRITMIDGARPVDTIQNELQQCVLRLPGIKQQMQKE